MRGRETGDTQTAKRTVLAPRNNHRVLIAHRSEDEARNGTAVRHDEEDEGKPAGQGKAATKVKPLNNLYRLVCRAFPSEALDAREQSSPGNSASIQVCQSLLFHFLINEGELNFRIV